MIKSKVGLEAEFLLRNAKGELIIPPSHWDRDGFPLLGEIRGKEGKTAAEAVSNFMSAKVHVLDKLRKGHAIEFAHRVRVPLALYKKANREVNSAEKDQQSDKILNVNGIDISSFSDQIISKQRIQGIWASCGFHVHFSCMEEDEVEVTRDKYEHVSFPIGYKFAETAPQEETLGMEVMGQRVISLYKHCGYEEEQTLKATASRLNKPAVFHIVRQMDKDFFERFAPPEKERTKYRQPGFFELKPYGFEYRSLPFTFEVEAALFDIAKKAFEVLEDVNSYRVWQDQGGQ
jgi:hypothetical protein